MLERDIRQKLIEVKNKKQKLLTEQRIVENRIVGIFGSKKNIENFDYLSEEQKRIIALNLWKEITILKENQILNEGLGDILKNLFGNAFWSIIESMAEPLIDSILSGLGMSNGIIKNALISVFTTNWSKLYDAWGDCRLMTEVVAGGIAEGMVMQLQQTMGAVGGGWSFVRNLLGKSIKEEPFVKGLSDSIEDIVCGVVEKITGNAEKLLTSVTSETPK